MILKKVLLIQLPNPQFSLKKHWGNVPLAAGYLKAMAYKEGLLNEIEIEILNAKITNYVPDSRLIDIIVDKKPDIIGFSLYVWNSARSLYIAKQVKHRSQEAMIMVGGPEVTTDNQFILKQTCIDMGCIGEGEITFVEILKNIINDKRDFSEINGLFFKNNSGFTFSPPRQAIYNLDIIPSPYILGFIKPQEYYCGWIETSRGCFFQCKYCVWKNRAKGIFSKQRIIDELKIIKNSGIINVKFLNSDALSAIYVDELYKDIKYLNKDKQLHFCGFMSAEQIDEKRADLLKELGFSQIGIGLQSINKETFKKINRKQNLENFIKGCRFLMARAITLELEFLLVLPCDNLQDFKNILNFLEEYDLIKNNYITPFILLMLPGIELRKECDKYGICYNQEPPYQIIKTDYFSQHDIQTAIKIISNIQNRKFPISISTVYGTNILEAETTIKKVEELKNTTKSVHKIIVEIDEACQSFNQLQKAGEYYNNIIIQPLTLWFKTQNVEQSVQHIHSFLKPIISKNPFLICDIVLESDNFFSPEVIDEIIDFEFKETLVLGYLISKAVRVNTIFPWQKQKYQLEQLQALSTKANIFWALKISNHIDWEKQFLELLANPFSTGYIIDIDSKIDVVLLKKLLQFVQKNALLKKLYFKNLKMAIAFELLQSKTDGKFLFKLEYLETIVTMDKRFNITLLLLPTPKTLINLVAFQLNFLKNLSINESKFKGELYKNWYYV